MKLNRWLTPIAAALMLGLTGCGDKIQYSSMVSFGDSLSDVGTYKVGTVAAFGGGKYTVNSPSAKNWTELVAAHYGLAAPCAAQTGLEGSGTGFNVAVTNQTGCFNYAQGGARVTHPVGPGNKNLGGSNAVLGQLTVPVVTQMQNHLSKLPQGKFAGTELVTVMAGGNDVFINVATYAATAEAAPSQASAAATAAVTAMATAGAELAGYVKTKLKANGAKYIVVVNLPDVASTPAFSASPAKPLVSSMVTAFNSSLQAGLDGSGVLLVDAYGLSLDLVANKQNHGLTNVTTPACILDNPAINPLASSLICTSATALTGSEFYLFADTVHPTPYGNKVNADFITKKIDRMIW
jgi:phospholipase/lecithinase/hemolysin